ncbi:Cytochrome c3 [Devosia enhydra]|uniref:Cytochrome c3 n=1 Tax=Devosia enhydra TaxID=665118 RepID=A0A1K2HXW4_9HYPH|nr:cytochrome c3 family protein [Devosia enhydra]SFZ84543.1 Cytochrome c3 [Devosia enhydra]
MRLLVVRTLICMALLQAVAVAGQEYEADLRFLERWGGGSQMSNWHPSLTTARSHLLSVADETALLIDRHTAAGVPCESCHVGGLGMRSPPSAPNFNSTCVACHGTMIDLQAGELKAPNPHVSPHLAPGEVPQCTECHRVHEPGEVTCNICHRGFRFSID